MEVSLHQMKSSGCFFDELLVAGVCFYDVDVVVDVVDDDDDDDDVFLLMFPIWMFQGFCRIVWADVYGWFLLLQCVS